MALVTQFYLYFLLGRTDSKSVPAGAGRFGIFIIAGMNVFFHDIPYAVPALTSVDADLPPVIPRRFVLDDAIDQGKEGIVPAHADIIAGMNPRAPLSDQYRSGTDTLSGIALHTKTLSLAITTVFGAATTLLMCHCRFPLFCVVSSSWQASWVQLPVPLSH